MHKKKIGTEEKNQQQISERIAYIIFYGHFKIMFFKAFETKIF